MQRGERTQRRNPSWNTECGTPGAESGLRRLGGSLFLPAEMRDRRKGGEIMRPSVFSRSSLAPIRPDCPFDFLSFSPSINLTYVYIRLLLA
jgi:hypothetical protein